MTHHLWGFIRETTVTNYCHVDFLHRVYYHFSSYLFNIHITNVNVNFLRIGTWEVIGSREQNLAWYMLNEYLSNITLVRIPQLSTSLGPTIPDFIRCTIASELVH